MLTKKMPTLGKPLSDISRALTLVTLIATATTAAYSQAVQKTPASTQPADADDIVNLSVFEVTSKRDTPYLADKSVATTGFAADLQKIPLAINVVTEKFLADTGGVGFNGIIEYQAGISGDLGTLDNGSRSIAGTTVQAEQNLVKVRGQDINVNQRNGMPLVTGFSTENMNRVEIARGPMSVFIGGSTVGGVMNLVTNKPLFKWQHILTASVDSNNSFTAKLDSTGPIISKKLAYRLIAQYTEDNTWRDYSNGTLKFINPQILWRPFSKLSLRAEYVYRDRKGNSVGYAQMSTQNYQRDFDNPRQELLDLGKTRTGALSGVSYTVDEYRKRIGHNFGQWRTDNVNAYGKWVSLGEGEWFTSGDWAHGNEANPMGSYSPYTANYNIVEAEANLSATDWLEFRLLGRWADTKADSFMFASPLREFADGSTPLSAFNNSNRREESPVSGKIEAVITKRLLWINHHLLGGYERTRNEAWNVGGNWDYTALNSISVAASPNVFNSPAILTGKNILEYFDPAVHAYPNMRLIQRYKTDNTPDGVYSQDYTKKFTDGAYVGYSGGIWKDRITLFTGYRNSTVKSVSQQLDRDRDFVKTSSTNPKTSTQSWTFGIVVEPLPGLNLYASHNVGTDAQSGYLVNNAAGYDGVSQQERDSHRAPDIEGNGDEIGIKMEFFQRKLVARVGYFSVFKKNTLINNGSATAADPRNIGTWVDPDPTTYNPSVAPKVTWSMPVDGNKAEGFDVGITWQPIRNYTLMVEASHLIRNELTLSKPFDTRITATNTAYGEWLILNGRPLPNTPDDTLKIWQRYEFTRGKAKSLWFGFGIKAQSNFMPNSNTYSWGTVCPGYTVFDAATGYTIDVFGKPIALQLNVANLTDKLYSSGGRAYSPPRTLTFQAAVTF